MDLHRRHLSVAAELGPPSTWYIPTSAGARSAGTQGRLRPRIVVEEFLEIQKEMGITIVVENMPWSSFSHFTAPGDLDLRGLGLALDIDTPP